MHNVICNLAPTLKFNQSTYSVNEDDGPAQPVLVLSNPSSTDVAISVFSTDRSATGKIVYIVIGEYTVSNRYCIVYLLHT